MISLTDRQLQLERKPKMRYDDDANFETIIGHDGKPKRVLRDGGRMTVGLMMADAARRGTTLRFADGRTDAPIGSRPGFITDGNRTASDDAYRQMCDELQNAWRQPAAAASRSQATAPMSTADATRTDLTTLMARLNDARGSAYDAYVDELTNAWRRA